VLLDVDAPGVVTHTSVLDTFAPLLAAADATPTDVARAAAAAALAPTRDAALLVADLAARGATVRLASSVPAPLLEPLAAALGLPPASILAPAAVYVTDAPDDDDEARARVLDAASSHVGGGGLAAAAVAARAASPLAVIVCVSAAPSPDATSTPAPVPGADYAIALGGADGDWPAATTGTLAAALPRRRVAVVGSGAWACAATRLVAANLRDRTRCADFEETVTMYVHDEEVDGRSLVDVINQTQENARYLPGVRLGPNVAACADLRAAVAGASCIIFAAPHQFLPSMCARLVGAVHPGAAAVSLVKGMRVTNGGPQLISELIERLPGVASVAVLSGPNVAEEVAAGGVTEATLGFAGDARTAATWVRLFGSPAFAVEVCPDRAGVEMLGTLKNVVGLAVGCAAGAGAGANTRATLMRAGAREMVGLAARLRPTVRPDTFMSGAGLGDLVATCEGGRNARVGAEYARRCLAGAPASFDALEAELLGGQKLQGALTAEEVGAVLAARGWGADFPLFAATAAVVAGRAGPQDIIQFWGGGGV
jgi:glycerol-3-phosphate dehydrogenase (NAD+)